MIDCGIVIEAGFRKLEKRHPNISTFDVRENRFTESPSPGFADIFALRGNLVLSKSTFADNTFTELFQTFARHDGRSLAFDCRSLEASPDGWTNLYAILPEL
jgi:hypothetical protein